MLTKRLYLWFYLIVSLLWGNHLLKAQDFTLDPGIFDSCNLILPLHWEPYDGWPAGVDRFEIWANQKSPASDWPGPYEYITFLNGSTTSYNFFADDGRQHCVQILAISADDQDTVRSNEYCIDLPILQVQDFVLLDSASYNLDENSPIGAVTIAWRNDRYISKTPFLDAEIFRSYNGVDFESVTKLNFQDYFFEDLTAGAHLGPVTYRIHAYNSCGGESISNTATTIHLRGTTGEQGLNALFWTPYQNEYLFDNLNYHLVEAFVDGPLSQQDPVATYPGDVFQHEGYVDLDDPQQRTVCYSVVSAPRLYLKGDIFDKTTSFSNRVCLSHTTSLYIPNAFAPNGTNREFKVFGHFGNTDQFSMQIFNRFGALVFESKSLDTGWDGTSRGRHLPQGVYVYRINMRRENGSLIEKLGDVLLVR